MSAHPGQSPEQLTDHPTVLIDEPEDGWCETVGWVEAIVDEDRARDALAEFCVDDNGNEPFRPTGPAERVHLRLSNPAADPEDQRWVKCRPAAKTAVEFWEIVVA